MPADRAAESRIFAGFVYACQFFYGGWFLFHGLSYWLQFYDESSMRPGPGLIPALAASGVLTIVKALEVIMGLALLADVFTALVVVATWPITLMIAFVNASELELFGIAVALIIIGLNLVMSLGHLDRYRAMLVPHAGPPSLAGLAGRAGGDQRRLPGRVHACGLVFGIVAPILVTYWTV